MKSVRAEKLPRDALDILAWAFETLTVSGLMPMNAAEVRLDDPVENILGGGSGYMSHGGGVSERYYTHFDDVDWAVVIETDCNGDAKRGKHLIEAVAPLAAREEQEKDE